MAASFRYCSLDYGCAVSVLVTAGRMQQAFFMRTTTSEQMRAQALKAFWRRLGAA